MEDFASNGLKMAQGWFGDGGGGLLLRISTALLTLSAHCTGHALE